MAEGGWVDDAKAALAVLRACPPGERAWVLRELRDAMLDIESTPLVKRPRTRGLVKPRSRAERAISRNATPISPFIARRCFVPEMGDYVQTGEFVKTEALPGSCWVFRILGVAHRAELEEADVEGHPLEVDFVRAQWCSVVGDMDDGADGSLYEEGFTPSTFRNVDGVKPSS